MTQIAEKTTTATIAIEHAIDKDLQQHLEDDWAVNRIVNGQLVACHWSELTDDERVAARDNLFHPCELD